jgi:hypothetical protein
MPIEGGSDADRTEDACDAGAQFNPKYSSKIVQFMGSVAAPWTPRLREFGPEMGRPSPTVPLSDIRNGPLSARINLRLNLNLNGVAAFALAW